MKSTIILASLLCLVLFSCRKNENGPSPLEYRVVKLTSASGSWNYIHELYYNDKNHFVREDLISDSVLESYTYFTWVGSHIKEVNQYNLNHFTGEYLLNYYALNEYDGNGRLVTKFESSTWPDLSGNVSSDYDTLYFQYSNDKISKIIFGGRAEIVLYPRYSGENVSSMSSYHFYNGVYNFSDSITYQYDDKINPFHNSDLINYVLPINNWVTWLSKNNIVSLHEFVKQNGVLTENYSWAYPAQYTSFNYLAMFNGNGYTDVYEYEHIP